MLLFLFYKIVIPMMKLKYSIYCGLDVYKNVIVGKFWVPIFNYLEHDINVCLTHTKYVKANKGKKTNKKDSKWIANLYKFDLVRCSFIPLKDLRQLQELARYRCKLVCMKSSEKNRSKKLELACAHWVQIPTLLSIMILNVKPNKSS